MKTPPTHPGCWSERYESLRRHFLEQPRRIEATPLGLVVLLRHGVAWWMHRWTDPPPPATSAPRTRAPSAVALIQTDLQLQLSLLLAQMTVVHLPNLVCR